MQQETTIGTPLYQAERHEKVGVERRRTDHNMRELPPRGIYEDAVEYAHLESIAGDDNHVE
jgi:hypothetical protein